jgi:hypothetical protein
VTRYLQRDEHAIADFFLGVRGEEQQLLPELRALSDRPRSVVQVKAAAHDAARHLQQRQGRRRLSGEEEEEELRQLLAGKCLFQSGLGLLHTRALSQRLDDGCEGGDVGHWAAAKGFEATLRPRFDVGLKQLCDL